MIRRFINIEYDNSFFVFGARGTGKSTYIREQFLVDRLVPESKFILIDLLDSETEDQYRRNPSMIESLPSELKWVVIDEVQKLPKLMDHVHRMIEKKKHHFILLGSSARKLKHGGANLLAGRAYTENMFPFSSFELGDHFQLLSILHWGSLPKIFSIQTEAEKIRYLQSYVNTYLKEEILVEQLIRQIDPFKDFLEVAAQMNGKVVSYATIGKDIGVDGKTVKQYYEILQETFVGFLLPAFHLSVRKSQKLHPKFFMFDLGVKRMLERTLYDKFSEGTYTFGNHFESFLINEIYRLNEYLHLDFKMSYLTTKDDAEIDLILTRGRKNILIEVKSYNQVDPADARKLARIGSDIQGKKMYLLSNAKERFEIEGVQCLNWVEFLNEMRKF